MRTRTRGLMPQGQDESRLGRRKDRRISTGMLSGIDGLQHLSNNQTWVRLDSGLPVAEHYPAKLLQFLIDSNVSLDIVGYFCPPIRSIMSIGQFFAYLRPVTPMPEVTIAKNGDARATKHDVRTARYIPRGEPVAGPSRPEFPSDQQLWFRVARSVGTFRSTLRRGT